MTSRLLAAFAVVAATACGGPFVTIPGGRLSGPVVPPPKSFDFARDAGTVQLETRPEDPYSVNIACAVVDGRPYVSAGDNRARWVEHMDADPLVRLRIEGDVYELRAERVVDEGEMRAFADAWLELGAWARDPTTLDEAWVYRLDPR